MKTILHLFFILMLFASVSYASSPREDLYDEVLLAEAILDIDRMSLEEVECFISYLASCGANDGGECKDFYCDRDRKIFLIKYKRGRPIDRMVSTLEEVSMWMKALEKIVEDDFKEQRELRNAIMRYANITIKLEEAANLRYHSLKKDYT